MGLDGTPWRKTPLGVSGLAFGLTACVLALTGLGDHELAWFGEAVLLFEGLCLLLLFVGFASGSRRVVRRLEVSSCTSRASS